MIPTFTTYTCPKCKYKTTKETGCTTVLMPRICPLCSSELKATKQSISRPNPIGQAIEVLGNIAKIFKK